MSPRVILVLVVISLVTLGLGALVVITQLSAAHNTRDVWVVTVAVAAGDTFSSGNVADHKVPGTPDQFTAFAGSPLGKHSALALGIGHPLTPEDVITIQLSEVPVVLKAPTPAAASDSLDIYAFYQGSTVLVGKHLIVRNTNPLTVLVPSADEPAWIALLANNVPLFAAKSTGVGVPSTNQQVADALNQLAQTSLPAASPSPGASPLPSPSPSK